MADQLDHQGGNGATGDDPAVALLRAQSYRPREFEEELRALARKLRVSEKVIAGFIRQHMEPLWWGERGPSVHDFESFCRAGEKYPLTEWRLQYVRLGPQTRKLVAAWLGQHAVQVPGDYSTTPRCPGCGRTLPRHQAKRGALAS